jgi:DUF1680 family protein
VLRAWPLVFLLAVQKLPERGTVPTEGVLFKNETRADAVRPVARPFPLEDVRLLDGPFREAMVRDQQFLLALDPDRLLHTFRVNAGFASTAKPLGGWEAPDVELRGHSVGHYLSALALMYASTGDARFKARVDLIVAELGKVQTALAAHSTHAGYLSAFPEEFFDRVETRRPVWAPYYTLHKILAGLIDAHRFCRNDAALQIAERLADWVKFRMDRLTREQQQAMLGSEFGGMNEALANLYAATGAADYLTLAKTFEHDQVFVPLAAGQDPLDDLHANTQIPKMIGAAREYELTGEARYRTIATTFWTRVVTTRSYANGGDSDDEHFFPIGDFARHLGAESSETCNTYNMLKLTRHIFSWAPSASAMDYYERGLYNHILASQDSATGGVIYYCPLKPGAFRTYSTPTDAFWCCVGTGMENHAKYPDTIYFQSDDALWVNLFIPSVLTWRERGLVVRQDTHFPDDDTTRLTLTTDRPTRLVVKVRYPSWAGADASVRVNDRAVALDAGPGSYITIAREWKSGDQITFQLPMHLRVETLPGDPKTVAIFDGPVLLAGDLGRAGLTPAVRYGETTPALGKLPPVDIPGLVPDASGILGAIRPTGAPLTFETTGLARPHDVRLVPFFRADAVRYTVYWRVYSPDEWKAQVATAAAVDAKMRRIDAGTIDRVDVDSGESEQAHAGVALSDNRRPWFEGRAGRESHSTPFGYTLKVSSETPIAIVTTWRGGDEHPRTFDVLVEGTVIASETLPARPTELVTLEHAVPAALTRGKAAVVVTFRPHKDAFTGAVFDVRTVRVDGKAHHHAP